MMDATPNQTPLFGIELIRDYVLTDLLGSDYRQVIYWAGKRLARQFPVVDESELASFLNKQAGEPSKSRNVKELLSHSFCLLLIRREMNDHKGTSNSKRVSSLNSSLVLTDVSRKDMPS